MAKWQNKWHRCNKPYILQNKYYTTQNKNQMTGSNNENRRLCQLNKWWCHPFDKPTWLLFSLLLSTEEQVKPYAALALGNNLFDHYKITKTFQNIYSTNTALFLMDGSNNNTEWFIYYVYCIASSIYQLSN